MRTGFTRCILCTVLIAAGAASVMAQQFTGGVRGAVRDANGVIPGVAVTLTNEGTNISREVVTNEVGQFNFPAVPPGTYTLKSQISGYKTFESKGVSVGTQQFVTLDVTLEVGAISENVTVTGASPVVCTALDQCHVVGTCNPTTGACSNPNKADGVACDDGDACTQTDTCQSGICSGSNPVVCTASDPCHVAGTCPPSTR